MSDRDADLTIHAHETFFERDWGRHHSEHRELEVEINFEVEGETLADLILAADRRAAELAAGRPWYIFRLLAEETSLGLEAEVTAYVSVARALGTNGTAGREIVREGL